MLWKRNGVRSRFAEEKFEILNLEILEIMDASFYSPKKKYLEYENVVSQKIQFLPRAPRSLT